MATIKEYSISEMGQPAHAKIEKNNKGYNYELSLHGEDITMVLNELFAARVRTEKELMKDVWEAKSDVPVFK